MVKACKEGHTRRFVYRCLAPLKGRKGQGKGRISSRRGVNCKYGLSKSTGRCRTKQRHMQNKRTKINAKYIRKKGFVIPEGVKRPPRNRLSKPAYNGDVTFRNRGGSMVTVK